MGIGKSEWIGVASPLKSSYGFKGKPPLLSFLKSYLARFHLRQQCFGLGILKKGTSEDLPILILLLLCCVSLKKNCLSIYYHKTFVYKQQFQRMCSGNQLVFLPPPQHYFSFSHPFTRYLELNCGQSPTSGLLSPLRPESTLFHSLLATMGSPGMRVVRADRRQLMNGRSNYEDFYGFQYSRNGMPLIFYFKTFDSFPSNTCGLKKGFYGK